MIAVAVFAMTVAIVAILAGTAWIIVAATEAYTDGASDSWGDPDSDFHVGLPRLFYVIGLGEKARDERRDAIKNARAAARKARS